MTIIKYKNGENEIHNNNGFQVIGCTDKDIEGLNPKDLLEASLGLCLSFTLKHLLERDGLSTDNIATDIEITSDFDGDGKNLINNFKVKVVFPENLTTEYKKKAMIIIERGCTISNTLKNPSIVDIVEVKSIDS